MHRQVMVPGVAQRQSRRHIHWVPAMLCCTQPRASGGSSTRPKMPVVFGFVQVRSRAGVAVPDGVDALAAVLLAELGAAGRLEALLAGPNAAPLAAVAGALRACGRWHALALLSARRGDAEGALRVWQARLW